MASDTRGVWTIRTEKVERLFCELDGLMLGCRIQQQADGLAEAVMLRRRIALELEDERGTKSDRPAGQAHERGALTPE